MKLEELKTIEQLSQFLDGTQAVIFKITTVKKEGYVIVKCGNLPSAEFNNISAVILRY